MPTEGIMPVSGILDVVRPMARSAIDIAHALDAMTDKLRGRNAPKGRYASKVTGSWDGLRLGAVNTAKWRLEETLADPDEDWFQQQVFMGILLSMICWNCGLTDGSLGA